MATQSSKARTMMSVVIICLVMVATYGAKLGYATTTTDPLVYWGYALACGLVVLVTCEVMVMMIPRAELTERLMLTGATVLVVMPLTFLFSTQFGAIALGGKTVANAHIQTTGIAADKTALALYRQLKKELNMAPQLRALAATFDNLAGREAVGALSGMVGEGAVVATLRSTQNLLLNTAKAIEEVGSRGEDLFAKYQKLSNNGRKIASEVQGTEITNGPRMRELNAKFGDNLAEINGVLVEMRSTSAIEFVKMVSSNLGKLTLTPKESDTAAQKAAIAKLEQPVKTAQAMVAEMTEGDELVENTDQVFSVMDPQEAIWVYADRIRPMWGAAIAVDFAPFIFAFFAFAIRKQTKEDNDMEAAQREEAKTNALGAPERRPASLGRVMRE
jgi:hypothetical protein